MGTFTALGTAELDALAAAFGLGRVESARAIAAGTINSNFEIRTPRGTFFLRVNEGKSEGDVAWEARLVTALARAGVPTPPPLAARDGRPYAPLSIAPGPTAPLPRARPAHDTLTEDVKWVSAFAWRAGDHLAADAVTAAHAGLLGEALARLHVAGLALPGEWRRRSIYDHDHLVARFEQIRRAADPELAHATAVLADELAIAAAAAPIRAAATHGIIHGDLFRDNVLWEPLESSVRISAILDFEQASGGSLVYDLAVCLNDWCWTGTPRPELARALIAGYEQVRPLTAGDRDALPYEVRAAAARFTITRITDVYLAKVTNPEKDFRAFLARVEAWRTPSLGQLTGSG